MNAGTANNASSTSSPFINRRNDALGSNLIGKSAWGQDWFLPNPRLEASSASSNSSSSFIDASFSPASPFTFHPHLNHGVLDRYDLFPPSMPNDNSSDAGLGASHNDANGSGGASAGGTGFKGYHSQIAGDLISGAGARMHQQPFSTSMSSLSLANMYSAFGANGSEISGLGLEGIPEDAGIHPMQLHSHTSSFSAIDELGLTGISLNDHPDSSAGSNIATTNHNARDAMDDGTMHDVLDMTYHGLQSPSKQHQQQLQQLGQQHGQRKETHEPEDLESSQLSDAFDIDDLVDMSNELHATPPATPQLTQPRPLRRSSGGSMLNNFDHSGMSSGGHARSISVPPSEARNGGGNNLGVPMSMDDVGLHMHSHSHSLSLGGQGHNQTNSQFEMNLGKGLQALFGIPSPSQLSSSRSFVGSGHQQQRQSRNTEPMRLTNSTGSMQHPLSAPLHQQQQQQQSPQPPTLFPSHLMLPSAHPSVIPNSASSHSQNNNHALTQPPNNDPWRLTSSSATWMNPNTISSSDLYNVPYLDSYYTTYGSMSNTGQNGNGVSLGNLDATLDDHSDTRQGQALDLAQSAVLASSGLSLSNFATFGLNFGSKGTDTSPSPSGTIRAHHLSSRPSLSTKQQGPPSDSFASVAAVLAAAAVVGDANSNGGDPGSKTLDFDSSGTGTIRQSHFRSNASGGGSSGGAGRSMSHHRGQSAVCPQDLMLRNDNKRKRASWDGGLV